jgi:PIN domain nuclease of toxin-antitoxin system
VKLLLDTHTLIWYAKQPENLSLHALGLINDKRNAAFVSIASFWEVAIKQSLGKIRITAVEELEARCRAQAFELLPMEMNAIHAVASLPDHHRDPFDRMLIAQAMVNDLLLVSCDPSLDAYGIQRIW